MSVLVEQIKNAQSRIQSLKRQCAEIKVATEETSNIQSSASSKYEQGMQFVEQFKKARIEKGLTRMDWVTCLAKCRKKNLLINYKNGNSLRSQFTKYTKRREKNIPSPTL